MPFTVDSWGQGGLWEELQWVNRGASGQAIILGDPDLHAGFEYFYVRGLLIDAVAETHDNGFRCYMQRHQENKYFFGRKTMNQNYSQFSSSSGVNYWSMSSESGIGISFYLLEIMIQTFRGGEDSTNYRCTLSRSSAPFTIWQTSGYYSASTIPLSDIPLVIDWSSGESSIGASIYLYGGGRKDVSHLPP